MQHTKVQTSGAHIPSAHRGEPSIINTHMFHDSFGALPGRANAVGGSATVHAMQALELGNRGVMVAPCSDPGNALRGLTLPAVGYSFRGNTSSQPDEWYEPRNLQFLTDKIMKEHTGGNDLVYAHMPISGQVGMEYCRSNNNPLVYLGHAWEILSATFFPDREIKAPRLATEYAIIDYLVSGDRRGFIVTNTEWEANAIAQAYSRPPTFANLGNFMNISVGTTTLPQGASTHIQQALQAINSGRITVASEEQIRAVCVANPIGVDENHFNEAYRNAYRQSSRAAFFTRYGIAQDATIIGGVGRIHPQKDPFKAVEVFHETYNILQRPKDLVLFLGGPTVSESYYQLLKDFIQNQHGEIADRVYVPGEVVDAREVNSLLDIRLCTAKLETWGLSFQESLCMGVPSVALSNPVYKELYDGRGVIVKEQVQDLAQELAELVRNRAKRKQYGQLCADVGTRYNWKNSVDTLKNTLNQKLHFPI